MADSQLHIFWQLKSLSLGLISKLGQASCSTGSSDMLCFVGILHVSCCVCSSEDFNGSCDEQMKDSKLVKALPLVQRSKVFPSLTQVKGCTALWDKQVRLLIWCKVPLHRQVNLEEWNKYLNHPILACITWFVNAYKAWKTKATHVLLVCLYDWGPPVGAAKNVTGKWYWWPRPRTPELLKKCDFTKWTSTCYTNGFKLSFDNCF